MDATTAPLGISLPAEARVWWGWHDGAERAPGDPGASELGPDRGFVSLDRAISQYHERRAIGLDISSEDDAASVWNRAWLPITGFGDIACDCSVSEGEPTPIHFTNYHYTRNPEVPVAESFGQMVGWWIDAIDCGGWFWDPRKRRWRANSDLLEAEREGEGLV